jgi:hypothetical protein
MTRRAVFAIVAAVVVIVAAVVIWIALRGGPQREEQPVGCTLVQSSPERWDCHNYGDDAIQLETDRETATGKNFVVEFVDGHYRVEERPVEPDPSG